jgi:hypothetical protein
MEKTAYPIRGKRTRSTLSLVARTRGRSTTQSPGYFIYSRFERGCALHCM